MDPKEIMGNESEQLIIAEDSKFPLGICSLCMKREYCPKSGKKESLIICSKCGASGHPSCLLFTPALAAKVRKLNWECIECKVCSICHEVGSDECMMFCDSCDLGFHTFCFDPPLPAIPEGSWSCASCCEEKEKINKNRSPSADSNSDLKRSLRATPPKRVHMGDEEDDKERQRRLERLEERAKEKAKMVQEDSPRKRQQTIEESFFRAQSSPNKHEKLEKYLKTFQPRYLEGSPGPGGRTGSQPPPADSEASSHVAPPGPKFRLDFGFDKQMDILSDPQLTQPDATDIYCFQTALKQNKDSHQPRPKGRPPAATSKVSTIQFEKYEIDAWYPAPYMESHNQTKLFICEHCLKCMGSSFAYNRHKKKCQTRCPPGDEIYRQGVLSVYEVDGKKNVLYCQNLCLFAKMFLDHKTLLYDVEPFLFYVMVERNESGTLLVGYFSKEKRSVVHNVSCIVVIPIHQRKGYGNWLIDFSYLLSKAEERYGTPEKPLSDLGLLSYRNYWKYALFREFQGMKTDETTSIYNLAKRTCMTIDDVVATLQHSGYLCTDQEGAYAIRVNQDEVADYFRTFKEKGLAVVDPKALRWKPDPNNVIKIPEV